MATMDKDFAAQRPPSERGELVTLYIELVESFKAHEDSAVPIWLVHPLTALRQIQVARRIDPMIKDLIRAKHEELIRGEAPKTRSVLSLALEGVDELTDDILQQTCDSLKTFLFAGHDTTSIMLQWAFYELERSPKVAEALCAELDELLGAENTDPAVVMKILTERGDEIMSKMTYTSAFIKEILRLYPPAGSARLVPNGTGLFVTAPDDGKSYCLDGMIIYLCPTLIQRDRAVYGPTCNDFMPERWIGDSDTSIKTNSGLTVGDGGEKAAAGSDGKKIPASAWRPFERGPRACIGQELANIESKIILACVARRYEFIKVGTGAIKRDADGNRVMGENGKFVAETELYSVSVILSFSFSSILFFFPH